MRSVFRGGKIPEMTCMLLTLTIILTSHLQSCDTPLFLLTSTDPSFYISPSYLVVIQFHKHILRAAKAPAPITRSTEPEITDDPALQSLGQTGCFHPSDDMLN